ncbi:MULTISPECIES: cofactor-independent phosphoglycerate mutase [unclassified Blautia]|uniref:cofactor-independent phosphoglycerate mutase n=1 Tax=unclassified Blautia TaxID=2648079 RepID=UPI000B3A4733|nr:MULTISPECIES: cofactor-independent phosphoglycerate mutase [unclassified Blautia]OUN26942.1 cofactor-independent phosphoglycerate mutase [Blautia sp. An81]OUN93781.1 cofactor-independent phosphoglycerate mutase [Blautia sp. An46]
MKYIVVLGDGMADEPLKELEGKTPLAYGATPVMDSLAQLGEMGMVKNVPKGMAPGSDTANLSVLGYDPELYYSGRSPLEALNIGVDMKEGDVAIRANLVTLSQEEENYEEKRILDHSADEITTEEAEILLEAVKKELENEIFQFYPGTSYRHCLIWKQGMTVPLTPPHDIRGKKIQEYLPEEPLLLKMQKKSYEILKDHPVNLARMEKGLNPGNSLWFWGAGTKPSLDSFEEKFHKKGAMISAVDLLKGIAVGTRMKNISVEGANGGLDTNYEGKADAALKALLEDDCDFVYVHVEAPDEMGHQGSIEKKIKAIEYLDGRVVGRIKEGMDASGEDYRMLVLPDHPTPISVKTHTANPVPYVLYDSRNQEKKEGLSYSEAEAQKTGKMVEKGHELIWHLLEK